MDQHGRPMRVHPGKTRRELELAGFQDISETVIKAYCNPWPEEPHEKEVGKWFNLGLSQGLTALSYVAMVEKLRMPKKDVESLCDSANREICTLSYHAYCRM